MDIILLTKVLLPTNKTKVNENIAAFFNVKSVETIIDQGEYKILINGTPFMFSLITGIEIYTKTDFENKLKSNLLDYFKEFK